MKLPRHIPQLDVLRGLAVLDVMLYHAVDLVPGLHLRPLFNRGYTGVDLFFVLSGFLITGILLKSKDEPDYFVYFTNFYARRALRIWPLYYALLIFSFVLLPWIAPQLKAAIFERSHPWQSFPFFLQNLMTKGEAFDTLRVTWSLAIEEQFYLVWPLIVWLTPRRMLKYVALAAVAISMMVRWSVLIGLTPPVETYSNTFARLDGLGLGAFLALWIPETEALTVKRAGLAVMAVAVPATIALGGHARALGLTRWFRFASQDCCAWQSICRNLRTEVSSIYREGELLPVSGAIVPVITFMGASFVRKYFTMNGLAIGRRHLCSSLRARDLAMALQIFRGASLRVNSCD